MEYTSITYLLVYRLVSVFIDACIRFVLMFETIMSSAKLLCD